MKLFILKQCHSAGGSFLESTGKPEGYSTKELAEIAAKSLATNSTAEYVVVQELCRIKSLPTVITTESPA